MNGESPAVRGDAADRHRLVFVAGLHRSGTSPVARWIAAHPMVSGLEHTGVPEDEGQHIQDVYPPASDHGGPGRFAFDRAARLAADSELVSADARDRLWGSWSPHWDLGKRVLVEKSPPNLVRMRFLQAVFPGSRFVVVVRHPVAVAYATRKWSRDSLGSLLRHWQAAHSLALEDAADVDHVAFLRFEDLLRDPAGEFARILSFIGLPPAAPPQDADPRINRRYLDRWQARRRNPLTRVHAGRLAQAFEPMARRFGYSLHEPHALMYPGPSVAAYLGVGEADGEARATDRRVGAGA